MIQPKKNVTGKLESELVQKTHVGRRKPSPRQAAKPAQHDGAQPSAIAPAHPETDDYGPLMKWFGTSDRDFAKGLFGQLMSASGRGADKFDGEWLFFELGTIKATKPRDELEAMQIAQMAAVHAAMMNVAGDLARAEYLPQQESATRALNQLARTYAAQLEALKRYRAGSEQKVTVQTVSVADGGQAIVGNVTQAPHGAVSDKLANATAALADVREPAMEILGGGPSERPFLCKRSGKHKLRGSAMVVSGATTSLASDWKTYAEGVPPNRRSENERRCR
jgi:hypothetical protein